jgi:anti-sigma regulatory factor (Ser/Thr protein kinase)
LSTRHIFTIETDPGQLERIAAEVEKIGEQEDWPQELVFRVNLALEELGLNIINYGHDEGLHEIEFTVTSQAEAVTIEISDDGRPFDPLSDAPVPDVSASIEDRRIGGLGVHLVRTMMDDLRYQRVGGRNHITLVSHRAG